MTMLSFRLGQAEADEVQRWADQLGLDRSALMRRAIHRMVATLESERDAEIWEQTPPTDDELSLSAVADWGPAEDWSDWSHATR